jgi:hypothetical protein
MRCHHDARSRSPISLAITEIDRYLSRKVGCLGPKVAFKLTRSVFLLACEVLRTRTRIDPPPPECYVLTLNCDLHLNVE